MNDFEQQQQEIQLVLKAQNGNAAAFSELIERYDARLLYYVRRLVRDDHLAYDVMQNVWLAVYRQLRRLHDVTGFRAWAYRIAHNQACSELRKRHHHMEAETDFQDREIPHEKTAVEICFDNAELVHRGLQKLKPKLQQVLVLKFLEQMSLQEIASVLEIPEATVKTRLYYAKQELGKILRKDIDESGT